MSQQHGRKDNQSEKTALFSQEEFHQALEEATEIMFAEDEDEKVPTGRYDDAVLEHIEDYIGDIDGEFSLNRDTPLPFSVAHVPPQGKKRPFHTLITIGLSAQERGIPANFPPDIGSLMRRVELVLFLPPSWQLPQEQEQLADPNLIWPLKCLGELGRHPPHAGSNILLPMHFIRMGDDPQYTLPGSPFVGFTLGEPALIDRNFNTLPTEDGQIISFLALIPLTAAEIRFAVENSGSENDKDFHDFFHRVAQHLIFNPERPDLGK